MNFKVPKRVYHVTSGFICRKDAEVAFRYFAAVCDLGITVQTIKGWLWNDIIITVIGKEHSLIEFDKLVYNYSELQVKQLNELGKQ